MSSQPQDSIANLVDVECKKDGGGGALALHNRNGSTTNTESAPPYDEKGFANFAFEDTNGIQLVPNGNAFHEEGNVNGNSSKKARSGSVLSHLTSDSDVPDGERTNYIQTLMHLLNGFVGSGILSMPMAFRDGGIVLASALNPVIGIMSLYCIHMLLSINRFAMKRTNNPTPFNYHELALYAFQFGPKRLRPYARLSRRLVLAAIVITQIGGCCVYFTFIATNLEKFLRNVIGKDRAPTKEVCLAIVLPFAIAINWIRNIRHLTLFSTVSNFAQLAGMGIIFYNLFSRPLEDIGRLPPVGEKIPQFFVSTLFIYEGISVSMSLYRAIRDPHQFHKPLGVLNVGLAIIIAIYFSIGFFGYVQYGERIQGTITVNLPSEPLYDAVQLLYAAAVLLTYPIILYVPIQALWPSLRVRVARWMKATLSTEDKKGATTIDRMKILGAELAFRSGLVLITYVLAAVIPKLELLISLVGSVTSSTITITIPAILHTVAFWNQRSGSGKVLLIVVNLSLLIIGLCGLGFGFYYSLLDIIDSYKNSNPDSDLERRRRQHLALLAAGNQTGWN